MSESHTDIETTSDQIPVAEPTSGPGHRLRLARERKGLDIPTVAEQLHLPEHLISALEDDDYAGLPGPVFIKGYLRNYARLVDEPVDEVLAAVTTLHPTEEYRPTFRQSQNRSSGLRTFRGYRPKSGSGALRILGWILLLAVAMLVVMWWRGYIDLPASLSEQLIETPITDGALLSQPTPDAGQDAQQEASSETVLELQPPATVAGDQDAGLTAGSEEGAAMESGASVANPLASTDQLQTETLPTPRNEPEVTEGGTDETGTESEAAQTAEQAQTPEAGAGEVVLEFSAPCWVDIRDSDGTKVLYGGIDKGERHVLAGQPPFSVILGNNAAVDITVAGQPLETEPYTSGRVARFSIDPAALAGRAGD